MKKKVIYNETEITADISAGWATVAVEDVRQPKAGDRIEAGSGVYAVTDDGKKRRPTLAPPRTHWRLPVVAIGAEPRTKTKTEEGETAEE